MMESIALGEVTSNTCQAWVFDSDMEYVFVEPEEEIHQLNIHCEDDYDHCDDVAQVLLSPYRRVVQNCWSNSSHDDAEMSTVVSVEENQQEGEILLLDSFSMMSGENFEEFDVEQETLLLRSEAELQQVMKDLNKINEHPLIVLEHTMSKFGTEAAHQERGNDRKSMQFGSSTASRLSNKKRRSKRMKELKKKAAALSASKALASQRASTMQKRETANTSAC